MYLYYIYIYISTAEAGEVTDATTKIASSGSAVKAVKDVLDGAMANVGDLGKPLEKTESVVNVTKDFWALSEYKPPKMNTSSVSGLQRVGVSMLEPYESRHGEEDDWVDGWS